MAPLKITIVHCWTAPRSRSTALLYSFEARGADCVAIDEPLKRQWLICQGDRVHRPYKANMIAGEPMNPEDDPKLWERETMTLEERLQAACLELYKNLHDTKQQDGVIFCKHMSKTFFLHDFANELVDVPGLAEEDVQLVHKHMFLVRDPVAIVRSWDALSIVHNEACSTQDVGIVPLLSIFHELQPHNTTKASDKSAAKPFVWLDSDALAADPEGMLQKLCCDLEIPYTPNMMQWAAGHHNCDSRHAPWWYGNAHKSTGWLKTIVPPHGVDKTGKIVLPINPKLLPALKESIPAYEFLVNQARRGNTVANVYPM